MPFILCEPGLFEDKEIKKCLRSVFTEMHYIGMYAGARDVAPSEQWEVDGPDLADYGVQSTDWVDCTITWWNGFDPFVSAIEPYKR